MTNVKCSVEDCSYNHDCTCYAERVAIGGQGATEEKVTCCGTFLNKNVYTNLGEHTAYRSPCDAVSCTVATCAYNEANKCQLDCINVNGESSVIAYTQTDCSSFKAH